MSDLNKEFNVQTHYWDSKTRQCTKVDTYRMHKVKGVEYWERPAGSGNLFAKDGSTLGRITNRSKLIIDKAAEHVDYEPPKSPEERQSIKFQESQSKIKELEAEIASIKMEKKFAKEEKAAEAVKSDPVAAVYPKKVEVAAKK